MNILLFSHSPACDQSLQLSRKSLQCSGAGVHSLQDKRHFFRENGFVVLENVISVPELKRYVQIVKDMLSGKISTQDKRGDLGGHTERVDARVENCVQICHPYVLTSLLDECEHFRKGRDICNQLYGGGCFALDCSQILVKFAKTATETPWHQVVARLKLRKQW